MNNTRLNTLPPTLRENARYLVFEIISKKDFDILEVVDAVWQASLSLFGETGASKFSLWVPFNLYDRNKKRGIVKCAHTSVEEVRAAIASVRNIGNEPVIIHVLGVTGTILSAKKKFFGIVDLKAFSSPKEFSSLNEKPRTIVSGLEKPRAQANGFQKEPEKGGN